MKETRIIVCGGKEFNDAELLQNTLDSIIPDFDFVEIISGHAKGADSLAEEYAETHGIKCTVFPADWKRYGRGAGPVRNKQMLLYALETSTLVVAFWNGKSRGTKNMITQAQKAGVDVRIVYYGEDG